MKTKKYFNSMRWLAIAAIICTLVILTVMMVESAMPGDKSLSQSSKWTDSLQEYAGDSFDRPVSTDPVRRIFVNAMHGYTGYKKKVSFSCVPTEHRPTEYTYTVADTSVAEVDKSGYVTFNKVGHTLITVSVKDDPSIYGREYIYNYGTDPDNITSATPNYTTVKECQIITGFRLLDQDGNYVDSNAFDITQENDCVRFNGVWLTGMKVGKCAVTFSPKGHPDRQFTYEFETVPDPTAVRATGLTLTTNEITVNKYDQFDVNAYVKKENISPAGANSYSFVGSIHNPSGKTVLSSVSGEVKYAASEGTATVTIVDNIANQAKADLIVHVVVPPPTILQVSGYSQAQLNYKYSYTAEGDYCTIEDVTWSVVKGKAKISQSGVLSDAHLGTVVIRATYNADPSIYADLAIEVKLFTSFGSFIRKALGHFMLFVVIGFGLAASFFFLIKPRLASLPATLVSGFIFSLFSETLQLPVFTTGRMFAWPDVIVDFCGSLVGMAAAYIVIAIVLLSFRLSKRRSRLFTALSAISAKTIFKKAPAFAPSLDGSAPALSDDPASPVTGVAADDQPDEYPDAQTSDE